MASLVELELNGQMLTESEDQDAGMGMKGM
jgi:hypothetical protein